MAGHVKHCAAHPAAISLSPAHATGKFRDKMRAAEEERVTLNESITVRQGTDSASHTAGFEAWLRSRGDIKVRRVCALILMQSHACD